MEIWEVHENLNQSYIDIHYYTVVKSLVLPLASECKYFIAHWILKCLFLSKKCYSQKCVKVFLLRLHRQKMGEKKNNRWTKQKYKINPFLCRDVLPRIEPCSKYCTLQNHSTLIIGVPQDLTPPPTKNESYRFRYVEGTSN